ncbi:MAG: Nif11-like leader peptide family natural product precursor [Sneathiellaceae bacterium]
MSQIEMQRFASDLQTRSELAAEVKRQGGLEAVIATARAAGYVITVDDVLCHVYELWTRMCDRCRGPRPY